MKDNEACEIEEKSCQTEIEAKASDETLKVNDPSENKFKEKINSVHEGNLSLDKIIRENSITFQCDYCDFKSKSTKEMKTHKVKRHSVCLGSEKGEVFSYARYLKAFICNLCGEREKTKEYIIEHMSKEHSFILADSCKTKFAFSGGKSSLCVRNLHQRNKCRRE